MSEIKMVVVNGVRYRPEDAPESGKENGGQVEHKMRKPADTAKPAPKTSKKK